MILADISAWVEFDRATGSPVDQRLTGLIATGQDVAVTEPVIAEVAAGARTDEREATLRNLLAGFQLLAFDAAVDLDGAVRIYRQSRRAGVTPRGLIGCMIAAVCNRHGATPLSHDADLAHISTVVPLRLDGASLRP